jgi:DeoR/GlpR family transcriptional regulator of sugar metabolism
MAVVHELSAFDVVVTDAAAPDAVVAALRASGAEVHRA